MSERMDNALKLADRCWAKAYRAEPEFVERYLALAETLLESKFAVQGDEFREHCAKNLLFRPAGLHHNVWVSGVRALSIMGWIADSGKAEPTKGHNHMDKVTVWRSLLFNGGTPQPKPRRKKTDPRQLPLLDEGS